MGNGREYKHTYFVDLDGTLVVHNNNPDEVGDEFISSTLGLIRNLSSIGHHIIITTGRTPQQTQRVVEEIVKFGIRVESVVYCTSGRRYLINDYKDSSFRKAVAVNVRRNKGVTPQDLETAAQWVKG